MLDQLLPYIDTQKQAVIDLQRGLVSLPALSPDNGGDGEQKKADFIKQCLADIGVHNVREFNAPDPRVSCGHRPNLIALIPGKDTSRTFWNVVHMDVVPSDDRASWKTDPFELTVDGDMLYGRGVADNHRGLVGSFLLAKALFARKITPPINYGIVFVSDEETGNAYGIEYLLKHRRDLFRDSDYFLVPDIGRKADEIDTIQKSRLWLKFDVEGKQTHAARPSNGINSLFAMALLVVKLKELHNLYPDQDAFFSEPSSTFVPTKVEQNIENINTISGHTVFYADWRVLPHYRLDDIITTARGLCAEVEEGSGAKISCTVVRCEQASPQIPTDSEIVQRLSTAISAVLEVKPRCIGHNGFTAAFVLRREGFSAIGWDPAEEYNSEPISGHVSNERSTISASLNMSKVMAHFLCG